MKELVHEIHRNQGNLATALIGFAGGLLFICVGLVIGGGHFVPGLIGWWQTQSWEEVPCKIVYAHLYESHSGKGGQRMTAQALYNYEAGGKQRRGRRVSLIPDAGSASGYQAIIHAKLRHHEVTGEPLRCLVNPADPEDTVLFNDLRWELLLVWSALLVFFPWIGFQVLVETWATISASRSRTSLSQQYPGQPWRWKREWSGTTITASPDGLWQAVMSGLWLIVVYVPLAAAVVVSDTMSTEPESVLVFFPLAIIAWPLVYVWRRLRARRIMGAVTLTPASWQMSPGDKLQGHLHFSKPLPQSTQLLLNARCLREVPRTRQRHSTPWTQTLWENAWSQPLHENNGVAVDVELPARLPGTDQTIPESTTPTHRWVLEVRAGRGMTAVVLPLPVLHLEKDAES